MRVRSVLSVLAVTFLISACASVYPITPMESRKYDVCQNLDGFCWQYYKCVKTVFGFCRKKELIVDKIEVDFKDKVKAKQLYDMNFILSVRQKPL